MRCSSRGVWIQKIRGILTADGADFTDGDAAMPCRPFVSVLSAVHPSFPASDLRSPASDWLHAGRVPGDVAAGVAAVSVPARTDISAPAKIGRIEAEAGDNRKAVAGAGVNGDPAAASAFAITH